MSKRQPRDHRSRVNHPESWWERRRKGYGMNLYRNSEERKIAGVCAGIAEHFNVDHWVMRVLAVGGLIFFNSLMLLAYLAGWICLAPRRHGSASHTRYHYDENLHQDRPVNMFRYPMSSAERLQKAQKRMSDVLERVTKMESYVTSRRYELDKEFSKIEK